MEPAEHRPAARFISSVLEYWQLPEDERCEVLEGEVWPKAEVAMSPAPSPAHQYCSVALSSLIWHYLQGNPCEVYTAPLDIYLEQASTLTVVQPDITVICHPENLDERGYHGCPEWVIEIVSPSSRRMDYIRKLHLYEKYGVPEYWIIHPTEKTIMVFRLNAHRKYEKPDIYTEEDRIASTLFPGLTLDLSQVFRT